MWCSQTAQQGHAWPPVIPGSGTIEHRTQQVNRSAAIKAKYLVRSPGAKKSSAMPWYPPATSDKQTSLAKIESNRQSGLEENRSPSQARNALSVAYVRYTGYFICFKRREKSCQNNHGIFTEQWLAVSRNHRLVSRLIRLFSTAGCVELTGRKKASQWVLPAALLRAQQQAVKKRGKESPICPAWLTKHEPSVVQQLTSINDLPHPVDVPEENSPPWGRPALARIQSNILSGVFCGVGRDWCGLVSST